MTIKQFSRLCNCNPQTLRYYDHMDLLKPVKVDKYSGYRYYDEEQAFDFVKIKNLQEAGFTIGEIKSLLDKDNRTIYDAFRKKIEELERKLEKIRHIRESYQTEMLQMEKLLQETKESVKQVMQAYSAAEEFGIADAEYGRIVENVDVCLQNMLSAQNDAASELVETLSGGALGSATEVGTADYAHNPDYELVYEKHGWQRVKDFLAEFADLSSEEEYALCFEVTEDKGSFMAFSITVLGILVERNPNKKIYVDCHMNPSADGKNHFRLYRCKS